MEAETTSSPLQLLSLCNHEATKAHFCSLSQGVLNSLYRFAALQGESNCEYNGT